MLTSFLKYKLVPSNKIQVRSFKSSKADPQNHDVPWKLFPLLQGNKVSQVINPNQPLVNVSEDDKVPNVLSRLADKNVLSAIAFEMRGRPIGFIDTLDILTNITHTANIQDLSKPMNERLEILKAGGARFAEQTCKQIINESKRDPFIILPKSSPLMDAVQELAKAHRIAVADENVFHILAQVDVASLIIKRHNTFGTVLHKPISEVGLNPNTTVGAMDQNVSVMGCMRFMRDNNLSGIAVLDPSKKILTNFSASDLLGLRDDKFPMLALPVAEFLHSKHGYLMPPVICLPDDTVESIMFKMTTFKVHRIFVVDKDMKPIGVITLTDIMKFLSKATD
jgi:CBS domain-containing protein